MKSYQVVQKLLVEGTQRQRQKHRHTDTHTHTRARARTHRGKVCVTSSYFVVTLVILGSALILKTV